MFLRRHRKHAAGETCEYWTLCESRRTAAGPRQKLVATRGKLTGEAPLEEAGWEQLEALLDGKPIAPRQLRLGQPSQEAPGPGPRWELADVRGVRVEPQALSLSKGGRAISARRSWGWRCGGGWGCTRF